MTEQSRSPLERYRLLPTAVILTIMPSMLMEATFGQIYAARLSQLPGYNYRLNFH